MRSWGRDYPENRLLRTCDIKPVDEPLGRSAAVLRSQVTVSRAPSAVDAIVVALADFLGGARALWSDPADLRALSPHTMHKAHIAPA
jgi:hypothetical protein